MARICFIALAATLLSAFDFPARISEAAPNTFKIATSAPVAFPRSAGDITATEKSAVRDAEKFCHQQSHAQVFVVSYATPTDSSVTFRCADTVRSTP